MVWVTFSVFFIIFAWKIKRFPWMSYNMYSTCIIHVNLLKTWSLLLMGLCFFYPPQEGLPLSKLGSHPILKLAGSCGVETVLLCGCVIDLFSVVTWHWLGLLMTYLPNITKFSVSGLSTRYSIFVFLGLPLLISTMIAVLGFFCCTEPILVFPARRGSWLSFPGNLRSCASSLLFLSWYGACFYYFLLT